MALFYSFSSLFIDVCSYTRLLEPESHCMGWVQSDTVYSIHVFETRTLSSHPPMRAERERERKKERKKERDRKRIFWKCSNKNDVKKEKGYRLSGSIDK